MKKESGRALFSIYKNIFRAGFLVTENSNVFYTQGLPSSPLSAIMVCGICSSASSAGGWCIASEERGYIR